jgi:hypothetical protein
MRIPERINVNTDGFTGADEFVELLPHRRWEGALVLFWAINFIANFLVQHRHTDFRAIVFAPSPPAISHPNSDPAFFMYIGLRQWNGDLVYRDIFDIKPPLTHEFMSALAFISGGNRGVLYLLSIFATMLVFVGSCYLLFRLAAEHVPDHAAFAVGVFPIVAEQVWTAPGARYSVKYFTVFFALLTVWLLKKERLRAAAITSVCSVGFWQGGAFFPLLVLYRSPNRWQTVRDISLVSVSISLPYLLAGATTQMATQVAVAPLLASDEGDTLLEEAIKFTPDSALLTFVFLILIAGVLGGLRTSRDEFLSAGWFLLFLFFVDYDGTLDTIPVLFCLGFGLVSVYQFTSSSVVRSVSLGLVLAAVVQSLPVFPWSDISIHGLREPFQLFYWDADIARQCHVKMSDVGERWIHTTTERGRGSICEPKSLPELVSLVLRHL